MAKQKCNKCGKPFIDSANKCPHCGATTKKKTGCLWIVLLAFIIFVVIGAILLSLDETPPPATSKPSQSTVLPHLSQPEQAEPQEPEPTAVLPPEPEPEPNWTDRYQEIKAEELASFAAPQIGERITIIRRLGGELTGKVTAISQQSVTIDRNAYQPSDLTPESCDTVFAEQYARRVARQQGRTERDDYNARKQAYLVDKQERERAKQLTEQKLQPDKSINNRSKELYMVRVAVNDDTQRTPIHARAEIWFRGHGSWWLKPELKYGGTSMNLGKRPRGVQQVLTIYPESRAGKELKVPYMMTNKMNPNGSPRDMISVDISDTEVIVWGLPVKAATGKLEFKYKR